MLQCKERRPPGPPSSMGTTTAPSLPSWDPKGMRAPLLRSLHPTLQGSSEDHRPIRLPVSDPAGRQARHLPGGTRSTYSVP